MAGVLAGDLGQAGLTSRSTAGSLKRHGARVSRCCRESEQPGAEDRPRYALRPRGRLRFHRLPTARRLPALGLSASRPRPARAPAARGGASGSAGAGRGSRAASPLVLRAARGRVHAHPRSRPAGLDPGAHRDRARPGRPRAPARPPDARRHLRAGAAAALPRQQALLDRGRRRAVAAPRRSALDGRRARRRAGGAGDEPSRPVERHDPHRAQAGGRGLRRLRGRRSTLHPGRRRRQVPPRRDGRIRLAQRPQAGHPPEFQPQPPRGRRPGGHGPHARQAGSPR